MLPPITAIGLAENASLSSQNTKISTAGIKKKKIYKHCQFFPSSLPSPSSFSQVPVKDLPDEMITADEPAYIQLPQQSALQSSPVSSDGRRRQLSEEKDENVLGKRAMRAFSEGRVSIEEHGSKMRKKNTQGPFQSSLRDDWCQPLHSLTTDKLNIEREILALPFIWNVPKTNPNFIGREEELSAIYNLLEVTHLYNKPRVVAIAGLGGKGKTQLAKEYANIHKKKYTVIWWINAAQDIDTQYKKLAKYINENIKKNIFNGQLVVVEGRLKKIVRNVKEVLRKMPNWLLIFDNAESWDKIVNFIPEQHTETRGHILITTRKSNWDNILKLNSFSKGDAIKYICHVLRERCETHSAASLAELLQYYPLAITQSLSYIRENTNVTIEKYISLYKTTRSDLWKEECTLVNDKSFIYDDYDKVIKSALNISLTTVKLFFQGTEIIINNFLYFCSMLSGKSISETLLRAWLEADSIKSEIEFNKILQILTRFFLLELEECDEDKVYSMHDLIQLIIFDEYGLKKELIHRAISTLNNLWTMQLEKMEKWHEYRLYLTNACHLIDKFDNSIEDLDLKISLLRKIALYKREIDSENKDAATRYQKILVIEKEIYGEVSLQIAITLTDIGRCFWDVDQKQGNTYINQAVSIFNQISLDSIQAVYEKSIAYHYKGLASIGLRNFEEIVGSYKEALKLKKEYLRKLSPQIKDFSDELLVCSTEQHRINRTQIDLARLYDDLGMIHRFQCLHEKAIKFFNKSLQILKGIHQDNEHPDIAITFTHFAGTLNEIRDSHNALIHINTALSIYKKYYKNHSLIAIATIEKGMILISLCSYQEAFDVLLEASSMLTYYYKEDHRYIGIMHLYFCICHQEMGDYKNAKSSLEKSIAILKPLEIMTPNYGDRYAIILCSVASRIFELDKDYMQSLCFLERGIKIGLSIFGDEESLKIFCLNRISPMIQWIDSYLSEINIDISIEHFEKVLLLNKQMFGENHMQTARCYFNLKTLHESKQGDTASKNYGSLLRSVLETNNLSLDDVRVIKSSSQTFKDN